MSEDRASYPPKAPATDQARQIQTAAPVKRSKYSSGDPRWNWVGAQRACPECGRPQHYTGHEMGWCHDATFAMLACGASPALLAELEKPADQRLISHLTPGCTCNHRPGDPCNASCPIHLGAGLIRR